MDPLSEIPTILYRLDRSFHVDRQIISNNRYSVDNTLRNIHGITFPDDFLRTLRQQVSAQMALIRAMTTTIQETGNRLFQIAEEHPSLKSSPAIVGALFIVDCRMHTARYFLTLAYEQHRKISIELEFGPVLERGTPPASDREPGGNSDDESVLSSDSSCPASVLSDDSAK